MKYIIIDNCTKTKVIVVDSEDELGLWFSQHPTARVVKHVESGNTVSGFLGNHFMTEILTYFIEGYSAP